jgi:hypothetical protein
MVIVPVAMMPMMLLLPAAMAVMLFIPPIRVITVIALVTIDSPWGRNRDPGAWVVIGIGPVTFAAEFIQDLKVVAAILEPE